MAKHKTYGNWKRLSSPGILGLGVIGTSLLAVHLFVAVLIFMQSLVEGIIWFIAGGVLVYIVVRKDKTNMSLLYKAIIRVRWIRQNLMKRSIYKSGPFSRIPDGEFRLPSIAANISLVAVSNGSKDRDFGALIHNDKFLTFIIKSSPEGSKLLDDETIDTHVDLYSDFLNGLSDEPGLHSVQVSIDTGSASGINLKKYIKKSTNKSSSTFSQKVMSQIADQYSAKSRYVNAYISLTYSLEKLDFSSRSFDMIYNDIIERLPLLVAQLEASGSGVCCIMSPNEIYKYVRTSFDPNLIASFDLVDEDEIVADWKNVGPAVAKNGWNYYKADDVIHKSYIMSSPPKGLVGSRILSEIISSNDNFLNKRVTLLYRPMQYERSATMVETDLMNARFKANSSKNPTAKQILDVERAEQTAAEEALGSHLINFSVLVSVTLLSQDDKVRAGVVLKNLSAASRLMLREANGTQDATFLASLALGIPFEIFYSTIDSIQDML